MDKSHKFRWLIISILAIVLCAILLLAATPQSAKQSKSYLSNILDSNEQSYKLSAVILDAQNGNILDSYGNIDNSYIPSTPFKAIPTAVLLEKETLSFSDKFSGNPYQLENGNFLRSYKNQDEEKTFYEHFLDINEPLLIRAWSEKGTSLDFRKEIEAFVHPTKYLAEDNSNQLQLLGKSLEVSTLDMAKAYYYLAGNQTNPSEKILSSETSEKIRTLLHDTYLNYPYIDPELASKQNIGEVAGLYGSTYYSEKNTEKASANFVGFAPYDDPQIIVAISLEQIDDPPTPNKNILASISTEIFQHYLPERYFHEITSIDQLAVLNDDTEHLVYVGRPTCSPCKRVEPIVRNTANNLKKEVLYFNTDRFRDINISAQYIDLYTIESVPCLIKTKSGKITDKTLFVGENNLETYVENLLSQDK